MMPYTSGDVLYDTTNNPPEGKSEDKYAITPDQDLIVKVFCSAYAKSNNNGWAELVVYNNKDLVGYQKMTWGPEAETLRAKVEGTAYLEKGVEHIIRAVAPNGNANAGNNPMKITVYKAI